ncbi:Rieske 2Fe-2S domain-containing protein [Microbacterium luticocti]|uniref:Rieske 2Fe-2S domain-containing protein n=1 Tax=Microbacterium luticocti TaxID=451764 RepID=UPI00041D707A|nr:Rieske 2Fe-2S domain-containing protein [Microbacterium luticocti]
MGQLRRSLHFVIGAVEGLKALDRVSAPVAASVKKVTGSPPVKNALSGTWLGHQLHPALTDVPIGLWTAASVLDLTSGDAGSDAARRLVGFGALSSIPTAAAGAADWSDSYGPEQRVGIVHAALNSTALVLQVSSWLVRRRGSRGVGTVLSLAGLGLTLASAYLGGHLSLVRGVGVNHTAFQEGTESWTDVAADGDLAENKPLRVEAGGVPVVLVRRGGAVHALSATCTHAGGPLDEGTVDENGCVQCPWHGSRFSLADGTVAQGPATVSEPVWEVKSEKERIWVRLAG